MSTATQIQEIPFPLEARHDDGSDGDADSFSSNVMLTITQLDFEDADQTVALGNLTSGSTTTALG